MNRLALAAAQALAIRKLLTKSSYDNTVASGPPFPASHPSPALLAKLHLEASALYASAESLLRIPASRKHDMEVAEPLLLFARDGAALHGALARKWLGADAGVHDALGVSVGFLTVAKRELEALRDGNARPGGSGGTKEEVRDGRRERRERIAAEAEDAARLLRQFKQINDSVRASSSPAGQSECQLTKLPPLFFFLLFRCRSCLCRRKLSCKPPFPRAALRWQSRRLRHLCPRLGPVRSSIFASMQILSMLRTTTRRLSATNSKA